MQLASVGTAFPPHVVEREVLTQTLRPLWDRAGRAGTAVDRLHDAAGVARRHLALPVEAYSKPRTFTEANDLFITLGTDLAASAIDRALDAASIAPGDVDFLVVVTTTGIAAPSLDARLVHRLGLRSDVRRLPVVGLGCAGGAAGLARCAELAAAADVAALVTVELCSLTFQAHDASTANVVATGLFGDAAACAVLTRRRRPGLPVVVGSRSRLARATEDVLGFRIGTEGFRVVLGRELPDVAVRHLCDAVDELLRRHDLARADVASWVVHPGGPKVLRAVERELGLSATALAESWECLRRIGNVSSASVLCILQHLLAEPPPAGSHTVVVGMGPGFSVESLLLRWT